MTNPFSAVASWLIARPSVSHAAVASALTAVVAVGLGALHVAYAQIIAALVLSAMYYGREAGQLEHDLKHGTTSHGVVTPFMAFAGSVFIFYWGRDNLVQWLAAVGGSAVVAAILTTIKVLAA